MRDFALSGTQAGDLDPANFETAEHCAICHGNYDVDNSPHETWTGSLMAQAARDPLFWAQMTNANQDVEGVGYFCMRCHIPGGFITGSALHADGSGLSDLDMDGVGCNFCHSMVDPAYQHGVSPLKDRGILANLISIPQHYGNAMFVLDPDGTRRGPHTDPQAPHVALPSEFHRTGEFCGTCHDVGNVAVSLNPNGTYAYNAMGQSTPNEDPHSLFPLERTYTEWKLSAFANGGVDMGGRFGGTGGPVVSTCQDCHMPQAEAQGCFSGPVRPDLKRHEFAGASSWVLEIIGILYANDPAVDQAALAVGQAKAIEMVQRSATLELSTVPSSGILDVRVINETGHKLPTGHIEGRRVFLHVRFLDAAGGLVSEHGHYDQASAHLDEASTTVFEMKVGLSPAASQATGHAAGVTMHMALADTIEKDTRIPPRGFNNAAFEAGGAPVVGAVYGDGEYWADVPFPIPASAASVEVELYYQTVTRHYIEGLRNGNVTDHWGETLYRLWLASSKGAPVKITEQTLQLP
ncbi:MAG: hypothetical protein CMJ86_09190 [Planctomycetes bacterium]|nr:hypothetical protein [Planctomycetota bacterium]